MPRRAASRVRSLPIRLREGSTCNWMVGGGDKRYYTGILRANTYNISESIMKFSS